MKAKLPAIVIGLAIAIVAGATYRYFLIRSPEYAFAQIKSSIEQHDKDRFHEFVDLDSLLSHGIDDLMAGQQKKDDSLATAFATGLVAVMKPALVAVVKDQVERLVETGTLTSGGASADREMDLAHYFAPGQGRPTFTSVKHEGKVTTVGLQITNRQYDIPLTILLRLREHDGHLQLTDVANLRDVIQKVDDAEKNWKTAKNAPARTALDHSLSVVGFAADKQTDRWDLDRRIELSLGLKNVGTKPIKAWSGDLVLLDQDSKQFASLPVKADLEAPLSSSAQGTLSWNVHINQFMDRDQALWTADYSRVRSELKLEKVTYLDGEELAVPYPDVEGRRPL
jgi:hypothetical protein